MANPITWQDVAAPRGNALAIEAMLRSGRQAGEGLEQIGQTFMDANRAQKEAATGAAVAAIANSNDPLAQAAATPQGWQFDPLAVSTAANARNEQLENAQTRELSQESSSLQIQESQARLDDALAKREAEDLALPYRTDIFSGKKVEIDRTDPRWQTAAGKYALDRIDAWQKEYQDTLFRQQELQLRKNADARGARSEAEDRKKQDLFNRIVGHYKTGAGAGEDEGQRNAWIADEVTNAGMGYLLNDARKMAEVTLAGSVPTSKDLSTVVEGVGLSGTDVRAVQTQRMLANDQQANIEAAEYNDALAVGEMFAEVNNPYKTENLQGAFNIFQTRNKDAGKGAAKDWGSNDFKERSETIQAYAREKYKINLPAREAYLLVESTVGDFTLWDTVQGGWFGVINDRVDSAIGAYKKLQENGGYDQTKAYVDNIMSARDRRNKQIEAETRIFDAKTRDNSVELPKTLQDAINTDAGFQVARLDGEIRQLEQKLAAAENKDGYRQSRQYNRLANQLDQKIAERRRAEAEAAAAAQKKRDEGR